MGILTDFVIADVADAKRVGDSLNPSKEFAGLDAKGLDQIKLSALDAIFTSGRYNPDFMRDDASLLYSASDNGPWVHRVPRVTIFDLAGTPDHTITTTAAKWAKIDEFADWTPADVEALLRELIALARQALAENKTLLMWTSL